jgi:hypothetical protein
MATPGLLARLQSFDHETDEMHVEEVDFEKGPLG